jgi:hypothetical protein
METRLRRVLHLCPCVMSGRECRTGATKLSGERTGPEACGNTGSRGDGSGRFGFGMREYLFARDQSSFWLPDQPNPQPVNETDMRVLVAAVRLAYVKAPERVSSSPISGNDSRGVQPRCRS